MLAVLFLSIFIFGCVSGSPEANQYFDTLLNVVLPNNIRQASLDPAYLTNFTTEFEDKVKGKAEYFKGNLTGLSQAQRYSECQGPYYRYGSKKYNCTIGLNQLSINYDGRLKYGRTPKVDFKAKSNVNLTLFFFEVIQNPPMQPSLKNFLFQQIGQLSVMFEGLGPLNRFRKVLEDGFKGHVNVELFNSMRQKFQAALQLAVGKVPLPM